MKLAEYTCAQCGASYEARRPQPLCTLCRWEAWRQGAAAKKQKGAP